MHRYVQTWSGDNSTSWETLKYNIKMGLGLALSGISNTGHDIGGFSGPAPDPELFVRWVQFGVFMPRFSIHSWNDDGSVNEPWMYPEVTPVVRDLIKFRYRLIPYFYYTLWRYHRHYEPMIRPTFFDFPDDPRCWLESDDMMVGNSLLASPVVEPGLLIERSICPQARTGMISGPVRCLREARPSTDRLPGRGLFSSPGKVAQFPSTWRSRPLRLDRTIEASWYFLRLALAPSPSRISRTMVRATPMRKENMVGGE